MKITEITLVMRKKSDKIRLAPYCRVSSDSQDQLHSFAAQIRYYSEYEKKHPDTLMRELQELRWKSEMTFCGLYEIIKEDG